MSNSREQRRRDEGVSRRAFLGGVASTATALTIVPRSVLGGPGYVAPSDRITAACIGVGAQGTRVMMDFLKQPDMQIVALCDVNKESSDYVEWFPNELRDKERAIAGKVEWGQDWKGPTAGREPARRLVEAYYGAQSESGQYKGCNTYVDFRELLEDVWTDFTATSPVGIDLIAEASLRSMIAARLMRAAKAGETDRAALKAVALNGL